MFQLLHKTIEGLDTSVISDDRKSVLIPLRNYVKGKQRAGEWIQLQFICTHNSRRSHFGQVWAQVMAAFYAIPKVGCYSGGTEATAVFSQTLQTLSAQGFQVVAISNGDNPVFIVQYAEHACPIIAFSKTYDHAFNPKMGFAAIMTCDSADEACPFVPGAEARFAVKYKDPKISDNSPSMVHTYHERSLEIAREMKFVFE